MPLTRLRGHELLPTLLVLAAFVLAGCTKPDVIVKPQPPVTVVEVRYVRIPAELTAPTKPAEGPVSEAIEVARERKVQLNQCNADKASIAAIEGTKVPC